MIGIMGEGPIDSDAIPGRVEHYRTTKAGEIRWRWRILDQKGNLIVQGTTFHKLREGCWAELARITEFLDALMQSRQRAALNGEL